MGDSFADAAQRVEPVEAAAAEDDQVGLFGGGFRESTGGACTC